MWVGMWTALQLCAQTTGKFMDIHLLHVQAPSEWETRAASGKGRAYLSLY